MAFEQGIYTDVHDLGNRVKNFAVANGWTQDKFTLGSGTSTSTEIYLHKGTNYVSLEFEILPSAFKYYHNNYASREEPLVTLYGNTGFNTGNTVDDQPGSYTNDTTRITRCTWLFGPCVQYYFFTNATGDYIHVVIETIPNEFEMFAFGDLIKQGSYTGGQYVAGKYWDHGSSWDTWNNTAHSVMFDGRCSDVNTYQDHVQINQDSKVWANLHDLDTPYDGYIFGDTRYYCLSDIHALSSSFTDKAPMFPILLTYIRLNTLSNCAFIGYVPDIRNVSIENYTPGEVVSLGTDEWMVFPHMKKNDPATQDEANSGWSALAFKKIT